MIDGTHPRIVRLYHGSCDLNGMRNLEHIGIENTTGRTDTDFGPATYFTNRSEQAMEWATRKGTDGWLCSFALNLSSLRILNLDPEHHPPLRWLGELIYNRKFKTIPPQTWYYIIKNWRINPEGYDVILGYTADDQYFDIFKDFFTDNLSFTGFCKAVMLGNLGYQYAIRTEDAYKALKRPYKNRKALKSIWYPRYHERQILAKRQYNTVKMLHEKKSANELFFSQIVKMKINPDDPRVRFPREELENYKDIDNAIFEETDNLIQNGIYPGTIEVNKNDPKFNFIYECLEERNEEADDVIQDEIYLRPM